MVYYLQITDWKKRIDDDSFWNKGGNIVRIIRFLCLVLLILFLCLAGKVVFHVPMETVMVYYWPVAGCVVVGCVLIQVLYSVYYCRKINQLLKLMTEEKKMDLFIEKATQLAQKCKNRLLVSIIQINLAAAHAEQKQYQKAKELLQSIPQKSIRRFKGQHRAVYYANLAYVYYYLDEQGKALHIMDENKKLFETYQKDAINGFGAVYGVLQAFTSFTKGNETLAKEQMEATQAAFPEADVERDVAFLQRGMKVSV